MRGFNRRCLIGLTAIALIASVFQVITRSAATHSEADSALIRESARQCMLVQRISVLAMEIDGLGRSLEGPAVRAERLAHALKEFSATHERLASRPTDNHKISSLYRDIQRPYDHFLPYAEKVHHRATNQPAEEKAARQAECMAAILHGEQFLAVMTRIVAEYQAEADSRILCIKSITTVSFIVTLLCLYLLYRFLFVPLGKEFESKILSFEQSQIEADEARDNLARSEERFTLAVSGSRDAVWDWDRQTDELYYAPQWSDILGLNPAELSSTKEVWFSRVVSSDLPLLQRALNENALGKTESINIQIDMIHTSGELRTMLCRGASIHDEDGNVVRTAGSLTDVTELQQAKEQLSSMAYYDQLTGLPNRSLFLERLGAVMRRARRDASFCYAVLFMDFDGFKLINDSLGHNVGDSLLMSIAGRLKNVIREHDTASRFGGDEFVMLLDGLADPLEAEKVCNRLLEIFAEPHCLDGRLVRSTASIGLVIGSDKHSNPDQVIRDADAAMYRAKALGRAQFCSFDSQMHAEALERLNLEGDLQRGLEQEEFFVAYQPIVALENGRTRGFEALVRWNHPELGLVSPDRFLTLAEETGDIAPLGEFVLRQACTQLRAWQEKNPETEVFVSVNLSRRQLVQPNLLTVLSGILEETGVEPSCIKLEITETAVMDKRCDLIPTMHDIRKLGFELAIDDFGTGHSSLSCLHTFPVNVLKIDRRFTVNMEERIEFSAVMHAILSLAHHLGLQVVVEGVETDSQIAQLQSMDCELVQGFYFSGPLTPDGAEQFLSQELVRSGPPV